MQGYDASTVRTGPLLFFFKKMLPCTNSFNTNAIVDQTDLVSLPVAFIEPPDVRAGKSGAFEAEIKSPCTCTIFELAFPAMFRFGFLQTATALAGLFLFQIYITNRARDSTRRQHGRGYCCTYSHEWIHFVVQRWL